VLVLVFVAIAIYKYLLVDIITGRSHFFAYVVLWLLTAYVILPRLYRVFSRLYLPDYFFGRTQASDGLLGDPVNLAFDGTRAEIKEAMAIAGWTEADPVTFASSAKIVYAALRGSSYPSAPVSPLYLFNRKQDFAFEKDINGNPRQRHHVRFWKTPDHWWLPGGFKADWLAAGTFDTNVSLSLFTGQVTHKIDANVDQERNFITDTLKQHKVTSEITVVKHFTSSYHSRNGGGNVIHTDGALPFITLSASLEKRASKKQ